MGSQLIQRIVPLAYYALIALALGIFSYWSVVLVAPAPLPTPLAPMETSTNTNTALNWSLFGDRQSSSAPKIELIGIIFSALNPSASRVALTVGTDKKVLAEGAEIDAGYVVQTIKKDSVITRFQGQEQVLSLPVRNNPAAPTTGGATMTNVNTPQGMNSNGVSHNAPPSVMSDLGTPPNETRLPSSKATQQPN